MSCAKRSIATRGFFWIVLTVMKYLDVKTKTEKKLPMFLVLHPSKTFMSILVVDEKIDKVSMETFPKDGISKLTLISLKDNQLLRTLADMISQYWKVTQDFAMITYKQIKGMSQSQRLHSSWKSKSKRIPMRRIVETRVPRERR